MKKYVGIAMLVAISGGVFADEVDKKSVHIPAKVEQLEVVDFTVSAETDIADREVLQLAKENKVAVAIQKAREARTTAVGMNKGHMTKRLGYLHIKDGNMSEAKDEFLAIHEGIVPVSKKDHCEATMRLGYLEHKAGQPRKALEYFEKIANGEIQADHDTAVEASTRDAMLHHALGDRQNSMDVHEQIAAQASDKQDRLYSKLQLAGLWMEKGKGEFGELATFQEEATCFSNCRQVCEEIFTDPDVKPATQAIAELMHLETYYFELDFQTCIDLTNAYLNHWMAYNPPAGTTWNPDRQLCTAQTWLIFSYFRNGDYQDCIDAARILRASGWKESDPYPLFNIFGYSYIYEAFAQEALGNSEEGTRLREICRSKYHAWYDMVTPQVEYKLGLSTQ